MSSSDADSEHHTAHAYFMHLKKSRREILVFLSFYTLFAIVLRYCYPYPDITSDTGGYINAIHYGFLHGGMRPLGYSYFLKFIELTGAPQTLLLFIVQYVVHCLAMFFFYSTTVFLFSINGKYLRAVYLIFTLLFIPALYAANTLMADSLFTSLTIVIITLCLWLIHTKKEYLVAAIVVLMFTAIMLRYIGLVYPLFVIAAILIAYRKSMLSLLLIVMVCLLAFVYVSWVKQATKQDRGVEVFSAFGGWQKANNALHIIPHIDIDNATIKTDNEELLRIDTIVRVSYENNKQYYPDDNSVSYHLMWLDSVPLTLAQNYYIYKEPDVDFFTMWNRCGVLFSDYADLLVRNHFPEYFRYYVVNNAKRMCYPPEEILGYYADTTYSPIITTWFGWGMDEKIEPRYDVLRPVLQNLSGWYTFYWLLFIAANIYLFVQVKLRRVLISSLWFRGVALLLFFVWLYALASIYAAPVNLRFLLPVRVVILGVVFALLQHAVSHHKSVNKNASA